MKRIVLPILAALVAVGLYLMFTPDSAFSPREANAAAVQSVDQGTAQVADTAAQAAAVPQAAQAGSCGGSCDYSTCGCSPSTCNPSSCGGGCAQR